MQVAKTYFSAMNIFLQMFEYSKADKISQKAYLITDYETYQKKIVKTM